MLKLFIQPKQIESPLASALFAFSWHPFFSQPFFCCIFTTQGGLKAKALLYVPVEAEMLPSSICKKNRKIQTEPHFSYNLPGGTRPRFSFARKEFNCSYLFFLTPRYVEAALPESTKRDLTPQTGADSTGLCLRYFQDTDASVHAAVQCFSTAGKMPCWCAQPTLQRCLLISV